MWSDFPDDLVPKIRQACADLLVCETRKRGRDGELETYFPKAAIERFLKDMEPFKKHLNKRNLDRVLLIEAKLPVWLDAAAYGGKFREFKKLVTDLKNDWDYVF